jgi:hypothetical protein
MHRSTRNRARNRVTAIALCALAALCGTATRAVALPTLDELIADFGLSAGDADRVRKGELVKTTTTETSEKELAVAMVFLVKAPVQTLTAAFATGAGFRNDPQVQAATEIKGDGSVEDFKAVVLQPGGDKEAQRYLDAAPGDTLNLSTAEIGAFAAVKSSDAAGKAPVEEALRKQLLGRYQAYRSQGLAGIAPYARGKDKQSQPAESLRQASEAAKGIKKYAPAFYDVLLHYPQAKPAGFGEHFFAIRYAMDGRPNFTLRHRMTMPLEGGYVLADREFYVSHEYNETQAIGGLLPVNEGTVVVYLNRTTTDQLGGFGASAKQSIGRSMMAKQIGEIFEKNRAGFNGK